MRLISWLGVPLMALVLSACGGGGGGGGGPGGSQGNFTIATTSLTFNAAVNGPAPAVQTVQGSITGVNSTVFLFVVHTTNGIAGASVELTGETTGVLSVFPKSPSQIGAGTKTDTVTLRACLDSNCSSQISGSPKTISVTYNVAGLQVTQSNVTLTAVEGLASTAATVNVQNFSGASAVTTAVTYGAGASNWLTVTPPTASSQSASFNVSGAGSLVPGTYTATLTISAGAFNVGIPVTYTVTKNLSVDATNVAFAAVTGQAMRPSAATVNVSTALASTTYTATIDYGPAGSGWLAVSGSAAPGALLVQPSTTNLGPGNFTATVVLTPVNGASVSFPVSYNLVGSSLTLTPNAQSFAIDAASTSAATFTQRTVTTGDTGAALSWTAQSSVPWLTVTASGASGSPATLTILPDQIGSLPNGPSAAIVTFTYSGPGVLSATRTLGVTLNMNLPTVNFASPYVAYVNEQKEVVIRGSGFSQAGLGPVMFDGVAAASSFVRSDTEIRVLPPLYSSSARPRITIGNALGLDRSRAELVVRAHPNYGYSSIVTNIGRQNLHSIYDAERDAVLSARAFFEIGTELLSFVNRFQYDAGSGTWSMTSRAFTLLFDIAMSRDGKELLVLCRDELHRVDPVTLQIRSSVTLPNSGRLGTASQMVVANDGLVLIRELNRTYSLLENRFEPLQFPFNGVGIDISADGSMAVTGEATNQFNVPLSFYDASTRTLQSTSAFQYYSPGSLERSGAKLLSGEFVRNRDFSVFGELRSGSLPILGDVMDPKGEKVYIFSAGSGSAPTASVRVFDVRVSAETFPELTSITLPDHPGIPRLLVTLDSRTLFLIGDNRFIVQPLP